jgi:hypothetical protein
MCREDGRAASGGEVTWNLAIKTTYGEISTTARLDPRRGVGTCSRHARLGCAIDHIGRQVVIKH